MIGRIKPGVSLPQAEAEMNAVATQLTQQYPDSNLNRSIRLVPMHEELVGNARPALLVIVGAVALVLMIACANVANLLLARAATREREIAIRTALGASRSRIIRQLLCESFILAIMGALGGLLLAWWGVDVLSAVGPGGLPRIRDISVNATVTAFTFAAAILSTVLFGLVPALQISRSGGSVSESLQSGAKGSTAGSHSNRIRALLVISQVALSLLLLACAGLLIRSFFNLRNTNPGFDASRVMMMDMVVPRIRYPEFEQQRRFYDQFLPKLATLPGVESVGGVHPLPFSGNDRASSFWIVGAPPIAEGNHPVASNLTVMGKYFDAMRIPVRVGRAFDEREIKDSPPVVMINEAFARKFFPDVNPVGQRITLDKPKPEDEVPAEIIGVVGDSQHDKLGEVPQPEMYVPFAHATERRSYLVLRTASENLAGMQQAVRRIIQELDAEIYVPELQPMRNLLAAHLAQPRFNMALLLVFASLAMVLASVGIYGVVAYNVAQRTREIGIRMALGAQKSDMLRLMLRQGVMLVALGLAIGVMASIAATRLLAALLYGVGANDFITYASVIVLLGAAAIIATYVPARRAMNVDPMVALRYE